jgi:2-amino-4-hydroxy-6-hydroxymethyldihydropteridine diphosphokinase
MNGCFLLLGTNLGDKFNHLSQAKLLLENRVGELAKCSSIYQTSAWGKENQENFLNQVLHFKTTLPPEDLLNVCLAIEKELGRVRFEKWGERLIDIDILYYNDLVLNQPELIIPHPEIQNRKFTLVPLVELAAESIHPLLNKSNVQLLEMCNDPLEVVKAILSESD